MSIAARQKSADRARRSRLWEKYSITVEQYEEMLRLQGGVCAICGRPPKKYRLHTDHCHATHRVRGLLCLRCNRRRVGIAKDTEVALYQRVVDYLKSRFDGRKLVVSGAAGSSIRPKSSPGSARTTTTPNNAHSKI